MPLPFGLPTPVPSGVGTTAHWKVVTIPAAKVAGPLTNFPVLVYVASDPDLRSVSHAGSVAADDGHDIHFAIGATIFP